MSTSTQFDWDVMRGTLTGGAAHLASKLTLLEISRHNGKTVMVFACDPVHEPLIQTFCDALQQKIDPDDVVLEIVLVGEGHSAWRS